MAKQKTKGIYLRITAFDVVFFTIMLFIILLFGWYGWNSEQDGRLEILEDRVYPIDYENCKCVEWNIIQNCIESEDKGGLCYVDKKCLDEVCEVHRNRN